MVTRSPTCLYDLPVLLIDCQATAANPQSGRLLEIGWAEVRAKDAARLESIPVHSYLVDWPEGEEIPRRVCRVTGLETENFASGPTLTSQQVWEKLTGTARQIGGGVGICPAVIHFARFEEAYLKHLHQEINPQDPFPFDIVCTHEITKRLLPDLPRRGLRAVAGYFGHSVPELRRSQGHLIATAVIWRRLVEILEKSHSVRTKEELLEWLTETPGSTTTGRAYPMDPRTRLGLPEQPGIYRMRRSNGDLLYIGKAKSLSRRVNSYFQKKRHPEHTLEMLTQATQVDVTVTPSALEAALLESDEIKRFQPPYNIALRERERRLSFFSADLIQSSPDPDDAHPIGPLPSPDSLRPMGMVARLIQKESLNQEVISMALGLPADYAPEEDCFGEGFALFRQKHGVKLEKEMLVPVLIRLGTDFWREKLATADEIADDANAEEEDQGDEGEEHEWVWTPERVAASLDNVILRGAYWIRRSCWLCLLSESSIAWEAKEGSNKNLLIFEEGNVSRREELIADAEIPLPPGHKKRHRDRRRNFDLMTLDRLIVVTAELRRLLSEGRKVTVRLRPTTTLRREKLTEALRWV